MTNYSPRVAVSFRDSYNGHIRPLKAFNGLIMATNSLPLPSPVVRAIAKLGADISKARRRRRLTRASLAERSGVSEATLKRLEKGDGRVALESFTRALHVLGETERLERLLDSGTDELGLILMDEQLPKRVRQRKSSGAL
jgi:DNA-binding XRE family transcriptional regulator